MNTMNYLMTNWLLPIGIAGLLIHLLPFAKASGQKLTWIVAIVMVSTLQFFRFGFGLLGLSVSVYQFSIASLLIMSLAVLLTDRLMQGFHMKAFWGTLLFALLFLCATQALHQSLAIFL